MTSLDKTFLSSGLFPGRGGYTARNGTAGSKGPNSPIALCCLCTDGSEGILRDLSIY